MFIFIILFVFLQLVIPRISFVKQSRLERNELFGLFTIKVLVGLLLGWISFTYYPVNDYWDINKKGFDDYQVLMEHPVKFFSDFFFNPYHDNYGRFFNAVGSYWNDLRSNIVIKLLAVCNVLSRGNYYINSLIFNFFGFMGYIALYIVFSGIYPHLKKMIIIGCFLLPSTLYFTSGIHKDLLVASFLSFYVYAIYSILDSGYSKKRICLMILSALMILLLRNFLFIVMIPASIALLISKKSKLSTLKINLLTFLTCIFLLGFIEVFTKNNFILEIITQRQFDFLQLEKAGSQLPMNTLHPTIKSFFINIPHAFNHSFLRPFLCDSTNVFSLFLSIELLVYFILFLIYIRQLIFKGIILNANIFLVFGLFISIIMLLIIGYIVPNTGSIVRYRSIYLPFLILPLLVNIRFNLQRNNKLNK